jgi:dTDP-4-dehydrorhamnose reductase
MTKILITGANGMFASDMVKVLSETKHEWAAPNRLEMDITNPAQVRDAFETHKPDVVIHPAAWTDHDEAEINPKDCFKTNVFGTKNIVKECKKHNSKLVYFSTCALFNSGEFEYNEYHIPNPVGVYSVSKYQAEQIVKTLDKYFIIRPGWLFGGTLNHTRNFVRKVIEWSKNGIIRGVVDSYGNPTYTVHLARKVLDLIETDYYDTYHITNYGVASRYKYIKEIIKNLNLNVTLLEAESKDFPRIAPVPRSEALECYNLDFYGFGQLPTWQEAIKEYCDKINL